MRYMRLLPKFSLLIIILVAAIIFSAFTTVSLYSSRALREQEMQSIAAYHDRLSGYVNDNINAIGNTALLYIVRNISSGALGDNDKNIEKRTNLFKNLQVLMDTNAGIHSVYFYSGVEKKVMYYNGKALDIIPFDDFFDIGFYYAFLSRGGYSYLTSTRLIPTLFRDINRLQPISYSSVTSSVKRIPLRGYTYDVVVVNIDESYFQHLVQSSNLPNASIMVVTDVSGELLMHYPMDDSYVNLDASEYQNLIHDAMQDGALVSQFDFTMRGEKFFVTTSMQHKDRIYYMMVPYRNLALSYSNVNMMMILIELIILGAGVCLAVFISGTISRPIDDMLTKIKGGAGAGKSLRRALIDYPLLREMDAHIDEIVVKNREQATILDRYFHTYRENILMSLLIGSRQYHELPQAMQSIPSGCAAYAVVACRSFGEAEPPGSAQWEALAEQASTCLTAFGHVEWLMVSPHQTAFILALHQIGDPVLKAMEIALYEVLRSKPFEQAAEFSIGKAFADPEDIPISYLYANEAFDKTMDAQCAVVMYSALTPQFMHASIGNRHDSIEEAVRDGDLERAIAETNIFFSLAQKADYDIDRIRKHCLLLLVYVSSDVPKENPSHIFTETVRQMLEEARTADELHTMFINEIENIMTGSVHVESVSATHVELVERVKAYVDNHYHENISLGTIADYVFFTPQYLGKLFKDITGTTFTNYIIHVRMNAAQALLISGKLSVAAISAAVGYTNVQSFGRTFKSFFGSTPGEYRRRKGITDIDDEEGS